MFNQGFLMSGSAIAPFTNENSVDFDGVDEYVSMGDPSTLDFERTDAFSFSMWIKPTSLASLSFLISKMMNSSPFTGYSIRSDAGGKITIFFVNTYGTDHIEIVTNAAQLTSGVWQHLVITYDGTSTAAGFTIYVDNSSKNSATTADTLSATTQTSENFQVSARDGTNFPFNGLIDEVSAWDKELTSGEVSETYNSGSPDNLGSHSAIANLIGWWRMGDGDTFPTLVDNSSNSNDGTMINMESGDIGTDVP